MNTVLSYISSIFCNGGRIISKIKSQKTIKHTLCNNQNIKVTKTYLQALTNCPGVRRQGYAANLVAITMSSCIRFCPENTIICKLDGQKHLLHTKIYYIVK